MKSLFFFFSAGFLFHFSTSFPVPLSEISELSGEDFEADREEEKKKKSAGPSAPLRVSDSLKEGNRVIRRGLAFSAGTVLPTFVIAEKRKVLSSVSSAETSIRAAFY